MQRAWGIGEATLPGVYDSGQTAECDISLEMSKRRRNWFDAADLSADDSRGQGRVAADVCPHVYKLFAAAYGARTPSLGVHAGRSTNCQWRRSCRAKQTATFPRQRQSNRTRHEPASNLLPGDASERGDPVSGIKRVVPDEVQELGQRHVRKHSSFTAAITAGGIKEKSGIMSAREWKPTTRQSRRRGRRTSAAGNPRQTPWPGPPRQSESGRWSSP